ncbi:MAG: nicotinamide-nucleotide amidase, partial [Flavobacteriales bacterium]
VDVVLMTGGLGPTKDDITKHTLCKYFDTTLEIHEDILAQITSFFNGIGREMLEVNRLQAALPLACAPLINLRGTAPGMWFERKGTIFVSMPGVPHEMRGLMDDEVIPRLKKRFNTREIAHLSIMTQGVGESYLAEMIGPWVDSLAPLNISLAYLPSAGSLKLRLSKYGRLGDTGLIAELETKARELEKQIPQIVYGFNEETLEEVVGALLISRGETLSTAESCTGGLISKFITSTPGSSVYFEGSIVSYSNRIKQELLGVKNDTLEAHGAVSEQVVEQMAMGAQQKLATTWSISTSGIAGPSGGSEEKPVGTVWISIAGPQGVTSQKYMMGNDRRGNIKRSALTALNMLRVEILKQPFVN